jgi:hypothetical protein
VKLYIPACGDRLKLTAPWEFTLIFEGRNLKFAEAMGVFKKGEKSWVDGKDSSQWGGPFRKARVSLPEGTVIECDRVYVRQYNKGRLKDENDYDSITWKAMTAAQAAKSKPKLIGRFWVKLPDCYDVEYDLEWDALYRDRVKLVDQVHDL